jgi:hypothetical protein
MHVGAGGDLSGGHYGRRPGMGRSPEDEDHPYTCLGEAGARPLGRRPLATRGKKEQVLPELYP